MGSVKKYADTGTLDNLLRHNSRSSDTYSNEDIDLSRTYLNYRLSPERKISDYEYYLKRKNELYVYGRNDVKTLASWVITAPRELKTREEETAFFESTYKFLENTYGENNVIQSYVHYDEGLSIKIKDPITSEVSKEFHLGRPHIHFVFIPTVKDNNPRHIQTEKICAAEVLTRQHLSTFHNNLNEHLKNDGLNCSVLNDAVKKAGRNFSVEELKAITEKEVLQEFERLQEVEKKYNQLLLDHAHDRWAARDAADYTTEKGRW